MMDPPLLLLAPDDGDSEDGGVGDDRDKELRRVVALVKVPGRSNPGFSVTLKTDDTRTQ